MSKEPTDGQVTVFLVLGIFALFLLGVGFLMFGVYATYVSITSFVAGNIWHGIFWGVYPWFVISGSGKAIADSINKNK